MSTVQASFDMNGFNNDWWKKSVIYQIYPKSFRSALGGETGDIQGIIASLDYLKELGVDVIWLTPLYQSPMVDNGYDISDYYAINPDFGTMQDMDKLIEIAHKKGIKIMMDIVVNHTSTEHHWFQSALGDKNSPYRDYYIWKDPANKSVNQQDPTDSQVPNNWQSKFGGSAWELDEQTEQYYLHLFAKQQADLNWENPQVRQEVKDIISFWAEKGIDGFRLDVINLISKDQTFSNDYEGDGRRFYTDGPRVHEYLQEISKDVFQKYGVITVGEMSSTSIDHCQQYSQLSGDELSMVFNFHHLKVDYPNGEKWTKAPFDFVQLKQILGDWQQGLFQQGWGALFWCNHDQPRVVSRFGDDGRYRVESAKMLAASLHMLQGTPYVYQGEEIGMTNPHFKQLEQYRDVESTNMYQIMVEQGVAPNEMLDILAQKSRDNSRTPMHWNDKENAGFTTGTPWIELADNYQQINVEQALQDPNSVFYFYKELIELRKDIPVITEGEYIDHALEHQQVYCYERRSESQQLLCLSNYSSEIVTYQVPNCFDVGSSKIVIGNYQDGGVYTSQEIKLKPYQVVVLLKKC